MAHKLTKKQKTTKTGREGGTQVHHCTRNTHYAGCERTRLIGGVWSDGSDHTESPQCFSHQVVSRAARPTGARARKSNNVAYAAAAALKKLSGGKYNPKSAHVWGTMRNFIEQEMVDA